MADAAVVLAGGTGSRMRDAAYSDGTVAAGTIAQHTKKQFLKLGGRPLICHSLETFQQTKLVDTIVLVVAAGDEDFVKEKIVGRYGFDKVKRIVTGGQERYDSVYAGLAALDKKTDIVFIHDGARPFVTEAILKRVKAGVDADDACVCAMPVKDTIKAVDEKGYVTQSFDRGLLWAMQTPQAFRFSLIADAYRELLEKGDTEGLTDDAMVLERTHPGHKIRIVEGDYANLKITTPDDLEIAVAMCQG